MYSLNADGAAGGSLHPPDTHTTLLQTGVRPHWAASSLSLAPASLTGAPQRGPLGLSRVSLGFPAGFQLSGHLLQLVVLRYADQDLQLGFDDFLTCLVRLENASRESLPTRGHRMPQGVLGGRGGPGWEGTWWPHAPCRAGDSLSCSPRLCGNGHSPAHNWEGHWAPPPPLPALA